AHGLYQRWGASRKVALLEARRPSLRTLLTGSPRGTRTVSGIIDPLAIDLASVMKASRSIAEEDVLEALWATTLTALAENAGAQRGAFVLASADGYVIQAVTGDLALQVPTPADPLTVPLGLVRASLRTGEVLVVADARTDARFRGEPYIEARRPRSVLVFPLSRRERFKGAVWLENDVTTGAFTADRVEVLRLLSAQALVATENARLQATQQRVTARTRQLEALNVQLAEQSEHKSRHLADMSHELRTPLNAIIGYAELLGEEVRDVGLEELVPDLGRIEVAARFLLRLINGVLDLSKIEAGRMEVQLDRLALGPLLDEIGTTLQPVAREKGNVLAWDAGGLAVIADGLRTRQILTNLIGNAAKFTGEGRVDVVASPAGPDVRIEVRDTGVGIDADALRTLFEPYRQASAATAATFGGTGLGLAIASRLAELMHGSLSAESVVGEGSTFILVLPRAG
ncbi:MAG: GAF domain-containing protein, partial [Alphaproteobacteria bacterium]|nr:GAF domain-containing protein [Alphaproteobacteria bacterium]